MKRPRLILCVGLPGSGKTTWARHIVDSAAEIVGYRGTMWRVNRDDYRRCMLNADHSQLDQSTEDIITSLHHPAIFSLLHQRLDVICDDTNLDFTRLQTLIEYVAPTGPHLEVYDFTRISLDTCIAQDFRRAAGGGYVGEAAIRAMHDRHVVPYTDLPEHPSVALVRSMGGQLIGTAT